MGRPSRMSSLPSTRPIESLESRLLLAATMVKDINTFGGPAPENLIDVNGTLFYSMDDGVHGRELWTSDGTAAGTRMVVDLVPGFGPPFDDTNREFIAFNDQLYFSASDGTGGLELWKSDGTAAGTVLVKDINPGSADSFPGHFVEMGQQLYFSAFDATSGGELWSSDGTPGGTRRVRDIFAGSASSNPANLTTVNGMLYFSAVGSQQNLGRELWQSDGTASGTILVKDIFPGPTSSLSSFSAEFCASGNLLYCTASDGTTGLELWRSDGTTDGTFLVRDIAPNSASGSPSRLTDVSGTLFFRADDGQTGPELWITNGAPGGANLVKDINTAGNASAPDQFCAMNGRLYFSANDPNAGRSLWISDGTDAGTQLLADVSIGDAFPTGLTRVADFVYFNARTEFTSNHELWRTDGTEVGTVLVKDIRAGTGSSNPINFVAAGATLYFAADDGQHGIELWKSDGSESGTTMVKDVSGATSDSAPDDLVEMNGVLYFSPNSGEESRNLWRSDGTAVGTWRVKNLKGVADTPVVVNNRLFFSVSDNTIGRELWTSDGTEAGTYLVKDINTSSNGASTPQFLAAYNGELYFSAFDPANGRQLWKSDGSEAGTVLVAPGSGASTPSGFTEANGSLFFAANSALWKTDGTAQGTVALKTFSGGLGVFCAVGQTLFFRANDGVNGLELWKSDGTPNGTVMVKNINPGSAPSNPNNMVSFAGKLYFSANDGTNGTEFWQSDGMPAGTVMVKDIWLGSNSSITGTPPIVTNGLIYFAADDGINGKEVWTSDGSGVGTVMLKDISPGAVPCTPTEFTTLGDMTYFIATDAVNRREIWRSDGTSQGTERVDWINPKGSAGINDVVAVGTTLFFAADNGLHGEELWKIATAPAPALAVASDTGASASDGYTSDNTPIFTGSAEPDATIELLDGQGSVLADGIAAAEGAWSITLPVLADGTWSISSRVLGGGTTATPSAPAVIVVDTIAPTLLNRHFRYETDQAVQWSFSEDVQSSLQIGDFLVDDLGTAAADDYPLTDASLITSAQGATIVFNPGGLPAMNDGNYSARMLIAGVEDLAGNLLAPAATEVDFFVLAGDANRDRKVDVADLGILASNWQQSGRTFSQGNFDYSSNGLVDVNDLGILASQWQQQLAAPGPSARLGRKPQGVSRAADGVL
jgi:trimeric autotransporter adhesin